ncbi:MAG: LLM class flavin-dependent oxidoreductase [Acidimicrobiia bacterium]
MPRTRARIGVQLPEAEREVPWTEIREMARTAEEVGFDSLWVGDHLLFRDETTGERAPWEAWTTLAGLASVTETVDIGPLVAATSFHSPAMLAKMATTVDEISGGRLILGLGAGWNETEYSAFGFRYDHRVSRFEEAFHIIVTLLREGRIDHHGRFYDHDDMVLLPSPRHRIPLMIGSNGPRMLRIAAPHVDIWNTWYTSYGNRAAGLGPLMAEVDSACADVGRDPAEISRSAAVYVQVERGRGRVAGSTERPAAKPIVGSHAEMAEELWAIVDAGVDHIQLVIDPIDRRSIEEMAEIVAMLPPLESGP